MTNLAGYQKSLGTLLMTTLCFFSTPSLFFSLQSTYISHWFLAVQFYLLLQQYLQNNITSICHKINTTWKFPSVFTVEPFVSNHPKCADLVDAYELWSFYKNQTSGGHFWEEVLSHETRLLSLTGGGHLKEVPILRLDWEYFGVLDKWLLMGGGHSWRFACNCLLIEYTLKSFKKIMIYM